MKYLLLLTSVLSLIGCNHERLIDGRVQQLMVTEYSDQGPGTEHVVTDPEIVEGITTRINRSRREIWKFYPQYRLAFSLESGIQKSVLGNGKGIKIDGLTYLSPVDLGAYIREVVR